LLAWGQAIMGSLMCRTPDGIVALRAPKANAAPQRLPVSRILPLVNRLSVRVTAFKEGLEQMSGNGATSGYRVAMVSGALEVSARLATAEELDLLVRVLQANKILWTNSVTSEPNRLSRKFKTDFPDELPLSGGTVAKSA
jgi:hypothetical protein